MSCSVRQPTIVDRLRDHAARRPDHLAYEFLPEQESAPAERLSYRDLVLRADIVAAGLDRWFAARPDIPRMALMLFPAGLGFLTAFWGCQSGRVIAIPAALPRAGRSSGILGALVANSGVRLVLTETGYVDAVRRSLDSAPELGHLDVMTVEDAYADGEGRSAPDAPNAEDITFLQYTSGSTSTPKGVVVRHRNLMANEFMIAAAMELDQSTPMITWVPHYHDMGLIGGLIQPIYGGTSCHVLAPTTFLKRPLRWLKAISDSRGVVSGCPDFGYRLCVERITSEQAATLDLSNWRVAFNGAEPVRASTFASFSERFAVAGFRRSSFYPCYGMAEATLLSTGGDRKEPPIDAISPGGLAADRAEPPREGETPTLVVDNGPPVPGQRIAIVDPSRLTRRPERAIGEIWLAGPNVAEGYYNDPRRTAESFGAVMSGPDAEPGPWLRTGDLGYMVDGHVFVAGRLKEMMIVNGRNLYPHDIEDVLRRALPQIRDVAVFSVPENDGAERIIAILELASNHRRMILQSSVDAQKALDDLTRAARTVCAQECELPLDHVRIALPGAVLKTTSGKTRYGELRSWFRALAEETRAAGMSVETDRFRAEAEV